MTDKDADRQARSRKARAGTEPVSGAARQAKLRAKGRPVGIVLTDPEAIAALDALSADHGGPTGAITHALKAAKGR